MDARAKPTRANETNPTTSPSRRLADRLSRVGDCGRSAPLPVAGPLLLLVEILEAGHSRNHASELDLEAEP
jgi:hypothetical protein